MGRKENLKAVQNSYCSLDRILPSSSSSIRCVCSEDRDSMVCCTTSVHQGDTGIGSGNTTAAGQRELNNFSDIFPDIVFPWFTSEPFRSPFRVVPRKMTI